MYKNIIKKSFTIIEIIVVMVLIGLIYFFALNYLNFDSKKMDIKVSLASLPSYLIENFTYEKKIKLICVKEGKECFVLVDGKKNETVLTELFSEKPEVYSYFTSLERIVYKDIFLDDTNYRVCFEFEINPFLQVNDLIVDTLDAKVYLFKSIFKKPELFSSVDEVIDNLINLKYEVRNAF